MTTRERNLLILAGTVILGGIAYNLLSGSWFTPGVPKSGSFKLEEANRLLRSQHNIVNRHQAAMKRLTTLEKRFFSNDNIEQAQINLLKVVEEIASRTQLGVQQKNMIKFEDDLIGVALEGKTTPESLIRFMQQTTESITGLRIYRLQVHTLAEQKLLSFQITISSLLVNKNED